MNEGENLNSVGAKCVRFRKQIKAKCSHICLSSKGSPREQTAFGNAVEKKAWTELKKAFGLR